MEGEDLLADEAALGEDRLADEAAGSGGQGPPHGAGASRRAPLLAAGSLVLSALALAGVRGGALGGAARGAPVSRAGAATAAETLLAFCDNFRDIELNRTSTPTAEDCGTACLAAPGCVGFSHQFRDCDSAAVASRPPRVHYVGAVADTSVEGGRGSSQYALQKGTCILWAGECSRVRNACWNDYVWGEGSSQAAADGDEADESETGEPTPKPTAEPNTTAAANESDEADESEAGEPTPTPTAEPNTTAANGSGEADEVEEDDDGDDSEDGEGTTFKANWRMDGSKTGCSNWEDIAGGPSTVEETADDCGQRCAAMGGDCVGFNFQTRPSDKCEGNGVREGACTLYSGACAPSENDCWDLYVLEGTSPETVEKFKKVLDAAPVSSPEDAPDFQSKLKEAAEAGDTELQLKSAFSFQVGGTVEVTDGSSSDTAEVLKKGQHDNIMLSDELEHSYAEGSEVYGLRARASADEEPAPAPPPSEEEDEEAPPAPAPEAAGMGGIAG